MGEIKIGVIGAGMLGSYHIQKCLRNRDVAFVGFHDASPQRSAEVSKKLGAKAWGDMVGLIAAADALIVATPSSTHAEIAAACMDKKRHVLVEKPLAPSHAEGLGLVGRAGSGAWCCTWATPRRSTRLL